jgi:hypothetical protein
MMVVGATLAALGLDPAPAHAQSPAAAPRDARIEIGGQFSATSVPTESAWTAGPRRQFSHDVERLLLGGVGVEHPIARRLSVRGDLQVQLSGDDVRPRVGVGFNVPIGGNPRTRDTATTTRVAGPLSRLRAGQRVWVTTLDGRETSGEVVRVDSDGLAIRSRDASSYVSLTSIKRIETPDPIGNGIRNGAIIGTVAAVTPVALLLNAYGDCPCENTVPVVTGVAALGGGVGAIAGAVIDSLHEGRRTLYENTRGRHLTVSPLVTLNRAGAIIRW